MAMQMEEQPAEQIVAAVKTGLLRDIESGRAVSAAHFAQIHRAIDLMRASEAAPDRLACVERVSCLMHPIPLLLRQGRVNAYASAMLKLRRAAAGL
jgi:hypothetical protein